MHLQASFVHVVLVGGNLGFGFLGLFGLLGSALAQVEVHGAHTGEGFACSVEKDREVLKDLSVYVNIALKVAVGDTPPQDATYRYQPRLIWDRAFGKQIQGPCSQIWRFGHVVQQSPSWFQVGLCGWSVFVSANCDL